MIIFIYGDDSFRAWQKLEEIKSKFSAKVDPTGSSVSVFDGSDFDIAKFREQVLSQALFSKERMIILRNLLQERITKKNQEQIVEIIDKAGDNVLVFWELLDSKESLRQIKKSELYKAVCQTQFIQEFNKLSNEQLEVWIKERISDLGGKISQSVIKNLIALSGNDLWLLENELMKLFLYKNAEEITVDDLDILVRARIDNDIWQFTDALARNNKQLALKFLNQQLLAGNEPGELLNKMIWQFRVLLLVKELMSDLTLTSSEAAKRLGLHPYVVQKTLPLIKNFTVAKLHKIYQELASLDLMIKSGDFSPELLLNHFIIKV